MIIEWLKDALGIKDRSLTGRVIDMTKTRTWGHNVEWSDWEKGRVYGWLTPKPVPGDELRCNMQSGKILRARFDKMEDASGVDDMFFADMSLIGYLEDTPLQVDNVRAIINP